jgi:hypothetical protein
MTYADKLKDPRWQKIRLEILNRDDWACQYCGDKETTLHVHHLCYAKSRNPWDVEHDALITYCEICHTLVEKFNVFGIQIIRIPNKNSGGVFYISFDVFGFSILLLKEKELNKVNYISDEVVLAMYERLQGLKSLYGNQSHTSADTVT